MSQKLWDVLERKVEEENRDVQKEQQIGSEYLSAVKSVCKYGVDRAETIRDTFPMYTLHNEVHICNVMQLMADLLGDALDKLSRDEAAMLIMSACCHDIGMSYSEEEKEDLFNDPDRLNKYLDDHPGEYVKAFSAGSAKPTMTEDMIQNYLRSIHHERVMDLLFAIEWPSVLEGKVDRENLINVCQSHGKDITALEEMEATETIDLRFCAILLRLADILDFDTSRAPEPVYRYSGFQKADDPNTLKSKEEWDKHLASQGFDFVHIKNRVHMYSLAYSATCKSMQVEQTVNGYLDWVDQELNNCGKQLKRFTGKWQDFILPGKIKRNIKSEGYVSGQYRLSLERDKILELLIGKDLYSDPAVFVRELIQNAIDAVRTREQLDKNLPSGWKGQINIRCWMDQEGYHWFRIEDNGIGMTEEIIMNYFLKIGSSYYSSDSFSKSKLQCNADADYMPISRFGIGILSCFMGDDKSNQVEISTKHFKEGHMYHPALRLSMHGINGYYYLSNKDKKHMPGPMRGVTKKEKEQYLTQAGTVIAVRTNLYQTGKYRGFKEIVDKYVIYPPVAIHYDGEEGSCDYPTEENFTEVIDSICSSDILGKNGEKEFAIPNEGLNELYNEIPEISFEKAPKLILKCVSLKDCTSTPFLKGAVLTVKVEGEHDPINLKLGNEYVKAAVDVTPDIDYQKNKLGIQIGITVEDMDFRERMKGLMHKYSLQRSRLYTCDILRKMECEAWCDALHLKVLEGLKRDDIFGTGWERFTKARFGISEEKLNDAEKRVIEFLVREGIFNMEWSDFEILNEFHKFETKRTFAFCSLSDFRWYNKYFKYIIDKTGEYSVAAHNGILCGDASFFYRNEEDENLATIILLKDKYRPSLDIARDGVRGFTLETACEIEIIRRNLAKQGFGMNGDMPELEERKYPYIVMADYCSLLAKRHDLAKQLLFDTSEGYLSNETLVDQLLKKETVKYESCPRISWDIFWGRNNLYEYLCAAFLRENHFLQIEFIEHDSEVFISKKEKEVSDNYKKLFPAFFFLPEINKEDTILTTRYSEDRCACNEYHRLSQFILKNGTELHRWVPGIFREILRILAEDDKDELIKNMNNLLENLRKFPGGHFTISDDLFLSEKDFV